jgi:hypothetical protein
MTSTPKIINHKGHEEEKKLSRFQNEEFNHEKDERHEILL